MKHLSEVTENLIGQPMFQLLSKVNEMEARGERILHFEMGDPVWDTPPRVQTEAFKQITSGNTHYVGSMGTPGFRDAICRDVECSYGFRPSREQVLVTPANAVIYFLMKCVVNPREEVIYPNPGFPTYIASIASLGAKPMPCELREDEAFRMSTKRVDRMLTKNTSLIIVNSPHNPTGSMMTIDDAKEFYLLSKDTDCYLLSDEAYRGISYGFPHNSPCTYDQCKERTVLLGSLSKEFSMTGWRLGYAVGPEDIIAKMGLLLQTIISCVPPFIQGAGEWVLNNRNIYDGYVLKHLVKNRELIMEGLSKLPGVTCLYPDGAFYAFPNIRGTGLTSQEFADLMLGEANIALLPGTNFGHYGEGYIRLSYATLPGYIEEAVKRMKEVLGEAK